MIALAIFFGVAITVTFTVLGVLVVRHSYFSDSFIFLL